jgi:Zn-dependent peptidase ImmA (M78 family)
MSTKDFKKFLSDSASNEAKKTIKSLPKKYKNLLNNYIFRFDMGTTLKNDKQHVGVVSKENDKKEIRISSGWLFSREFILLHEIGHVVYANCVANKPEQKEWEKLSKKFKAKHETGDSEESFCHRFASNYCEHPPTMFGKDKDELSKFFKKLEN